MGLMSRMPMWAQPMQHAGWQMQLPTVDPGLAAYGQTQAGAWTPSPQAPTDAAATAYDPAAGQFNSSALLGLGQSLMQASQPTKFPTPPPPQLPDPYRRRQF